MGKNVKLQLFEPGNRRGRWRRFATVNAIVALALSSVALVGGEPASAVTPPTTGVLAAGGFHTCGLTAAGAANCWGYNGDGQAVGQTGPYIQLAGGGFLTCGLTAAGAADCWGYNLDGQADDQTGPYTQLAAGYYHTCGLTAAGAADCWGFNDAGQADDQTGPYTQLAAGYSHTCGLTAAGAADCWGYNDFGQAVDQPGPYTQLAAGFGHTCGLTVAGAADCWGDNLYDQAVDQTGPYTQLAGGGFHTCGLTAAGAADCWGLNRYGRANDQTGPYTQLAAGDSHTCGLTAAGAADCWGDNYFSQAEDQTGPFGSIDSTPPTIGYTVNGVFPAEPDGDNGWYVGDVVFDWTVVEDESPDSLLLFGCADITVTSDQRTTPLCAATSEGGTAVLVAVSIARDATAPGVGWAGGPVDGATYTFGSVPSAPTCSAVDSLSGDGGCMVAGYSTAVGTHTLTATARDQAGNVTVERRSYTVLPYTLVGFHKPVDMGSVVNTVKGGSTVPFKFEVFNGSAELTDPAVVRSFTWANVACTALGAVAREDAIKLITPGNTVLRYDTTAGQFVQNWQTPKNRAGACFRVTMTTVDGSSLVAYFKLR